MPQNLLFFSKNPSLKKVFFVNVGLAQSIFTGQLCFHWPNLFCEIFDVRPSATKTDFF